MDYLGPVSDPGPVMQGFGETPQLIMTQGYNSGGTPPPSFTATGFEIEVGPI